MVSGLLVLIVIAKHYSRISNTLLFWMAFILTRPLGATTGDFFSKPIAKGGLGYGTIGASLILAAVLIALIVYQFRQQRTRTGSAEAVAPAQALVVGEPSRAAGASADSASSTEGRA